MQKHRLIGVTILLALTLKGGMADARAQQVLNLIAIAGQSNPSGTGSLSEWPANRPTRPDNLWLFRLDNNKGQLTPNRWYQPPMPNVQGNRVGPALPLADQLARLRPGYNVGLVPCAQGGSFIRQWAPSLDVSTLYGRCMLQIRRAMRACPDNFTCKVSAIFWWQGESDSTADGEPDLWLDKTHDLFAQFRADIGDPNLPILYVRLGIANAYINNGSAPYWEQMRASMSDLRHTFADGNVRMLSIDSVPYPPDNWHFTTEKYITIGQKAGTVLNEMLP